MCFLSIKKNSKWRLLLFFGVIYPIYILLCIFGTMFLTIKISTRSMQYKTTHEQTYLTMNVLREIEKSFRDDEVIDDEDDTIVGYDKELEDMRCPHTCELSYDLDW